MAYFEINNLVVKHKSYEGIKTVLDIDHLEIQKGETFGLVGESGQGKTVLALAIQQLLPTPPGIVEQGEILLDGEDLLKKSVKEMQRSVRGGKVAMIFQDPMSCMNPVFTVGSTMIDVLRRHNKGMSRKQAQDQAVSLLQEVKLADAESVMAKYPHQLSGGQRQRVIIALALCCGAEFMIADEPTRNLDVTIQASVLKLLKDLQRSRNITVLFIANNMSLVSAFCDRVAILHDSKVIEEGPVGEVVRNPKQEYTRMLVDAVSTRTAAEPVEKDAPVLLQVEHLKKYFIINDEIKKQKKDGLMTEDEQKSSEKSVQELTDQYIKMIDGITSKKEKEIMQL